MLDAGALQEVRELFIGELRSVVTHELLRNSMMCEQRTKMLNSLLGGGRIHLRTSGHLLWALNDDEPHVRQERSREIDVDPLPWTSRPFPWMQRRFGTLVTMLLAVTARGDTGVDIVVSLRPLHIAASEFLRAHNAAVRTVKLVQDILLQALWNDDASTPQKTSLI